MDRSQIITARRNPNRHTQRGIGLLESSMREDGYVAPMTAAANGEVLDGNARRETIEQVFPDVDPIVVESDGTRPIVHVRRDIPDSEAEIARRIMYRANRIAEIDLSWDATQMLQDAAAGIDLQSLGFDSREVDEIMRAGGIGGSDVDAEPQIDKAEELRIKWGVESGQLWQLGDHRLICGDCTDRAVVERVMGGEKADFAIHDPPYGIDVVAAADGGGSKGFGKIGFNGVVKVNRYHPVEGDDKPFDPSHLLELCDSVILWGANYYADKLPCKKGWIVWDKKGRDDWRDNFSDCELAWTSLPIVTRIFRHTWLGMVQEGERETRVHPTQKPAQLYEKIISELASDAQIIEDFYSGSGPTLIACERLGRKCRAVEIAPAYVAVSLQRWADATDKMPVLIAS